MPFGKLKQINEFMAQKQSADQASRQAVEAAQTVNQPSPMPAATPASAPTVAPQQAPRANAEIAQGQTAPSVMQQAQVNNPALQKMTWKNTGIVPLAGQGEYRTQAMQDMSEAEFAKHQGKMNASDYEYWTEQVKANPNSTYAILNQMFASKETPEEKRKRERREQLGEVFNNLGNLIGNAANLYYTHRGGQYIDLNSVNEKHRERMQRIKDKQDALDEQRKQMLINAKLGDIKAERAEKLADKKTAAAALEKKNERAFKIKYDAYMKELDNAHKMGQIDAQTKARLTEQAAKFKSDKQLEAFKQQNRVALKGMDEGSEKNKKSTFTYGGTAYDKKSLSSMVALYNKLRHDGYAIPKVKGNNINQYIDAIANSMSKGTYNLGDFSKGAEAKYPNIIDSDMNQEGGNSLGIGIGNNNKNGNKLGIGL